MAARRAALVAAQSVILWLLAPSERHVVAMTGMCLVVYMAITIDLARRLNGQAIEYQGAEYPLWSFYVSLWHNGAVMTLVLVLMLILRANSGREGWFSDWMSHGWDPSSESESNVLMSAGVLDEFMYYCVIANELKDFVMLDLEFSLYKMGMVVHHILTILGALWCLQVPAGKGIVTLTCINAEFGSAVYCLEVLAPRLWPRRPRIRLAVSVLYVAGMTLSNLLGILGAVLFHREVAGRHEGFVDIFWVFVTLLVALRQVPVIWCLRDGFFEHRKVA